MMTISMNGVMLWNNGLIYHRANTDLMIAKRLMNHNFKNLM